MNHESSSQIAGISRNSTRATILLFITIIQAGATGCDGLPFFGVQATGLQKFTSPDELKQYLADQVQTHRSFYGDGFAFGGTGLPGIQPSPAATGGEGFSTTNIQEAGVDESDVVKNDGTYLYILGAHQLRIVQAVPADQMEVISSVDVPGSPDSLYLRNSKVIILARDYDNSNGPLTRVNILEVGDRSSPSAQATYTLPGGLISSRLIGSKLHLVLSFLPRVPADYSTSSILSSDVDTLLPNASGHFSLGGLNWDTDQNLVEWSDLYRPNEPDGFTVVAIVTIDVDNLLAPIRSAGLMAEPSTVYASTQSLYLTDNDYNFTAAQTRETTQIHQFNLTGDGAVPIASGRIPGRLLNRFSLGEHNGYLRAATTVGHVSRDGTSAVTNNVYVLGPQGGDLVTVGQIEDIATGEQIYAARFLGDRGFLVTFKKVDPLFTLDLSDPTSPIVVGRLKVPGYSDYIHPLGADHLITIGKDAVDEGTFAWYQGVQLSVFDVTNFADPQQVDVEIVGDRGTQSEALFEPHAFNFFAPADLLAVPMLIAEGAGPDPSSFGTPTFDGLCVYQVTPDIGIEPLGRIATESVDPNQPYYYSSNPWTRGIFINDHVYAVTRAKVLAAALDDLSAAPNELPLE